MAKRRPSDAARLALGPLRPAAEDAHRRLAAAVAPRRAAARLRHSPDPRAEELALAALTIAGTGLTAEEAGWAARIEAERERLEQAGMEKEAVNWAVPGPWGRFLLRLSRRFAGPASVELGTGIGLSTAYLAAGLALKGSGRLITIERNEARAAAARELLARLELDRAEVVTGDFEGSLEPVLERAGTVDLAFIDSIKSPDHVDWCLQRLRARMSPASIIVIDDIHWSRRMSRTWRALRRDARWPLSADLQRLGLLVGEARAEDPGRAYDPPP